MRLLPLVALACAAAHAQTPEALYQRSLAATCAQCHGTDGHSVAGKIPVLAGMPRDEMVRKLKDLQSGAQPSTVMGQLARGFDDTQIGRLADWFAAQKK